MPNPQAVRALHCPGKSQPKNCDTRVKRSKNRRKLACRRLFELGTCQKHERITNVFKGAMCQWHMSSTDRSGAEMRECIARSNPVSEFTCRIHQNTAYMCYRSSRSGLTYENMRIHHHGFSPLPEYFHAGYVPVLCLTPGLQEK